MAKKPKAEALPAWQCLARSVDVDPSSIGMDHFLMLNAALQAMSMDRPNDPKWLLDMAKRWRVLAKALEKDKDLRFDKRRNDIELDTPLNFEVFLAFAKKKRWALPKALKQ